MGTLFCNVSFHVGPWCTPPGGRRYVDGIFTPKGPGGGVINPFMQPASGAVAQALPKPSVAKPTTKPARQEAAVPLQGELPLPRPRLGPNPKIGKDGAGTCEIIGDLVYYLVLTYKQGSGGNKKLPPRRFSTIGIVLKLPLTPNTTNPQTSPPWWCRLPLLWRGIFGYTRSNAGDIFGKGRARTL